MSPSTILEFLKENWAVVSQAPWTFSLLACLCFSVGFGAATFMGARQRNANDERLKLAEERVTSYKEKLEGKTPDEAHAQIAALRAELADMSSYGLSGEAEQRMRAVLASSVGSVRLHKASDASDADRLYRKVISVFRSAGWKVKSHSILGIKDPPDSGVTLVHFSATNPEWLDTIRRALDVAGLDAREQIDPTGWGSESGPVIVFTARDPDWVPAARWS